MPRVKKVAAKKTAAEKKAAVKHAANTATAIEGLQVAGSEPSILRDLAGSVTNEPEQFGVDFMWRTDHDNALWGVQRKEISDLIASIPDGRLGMELQQGQRLDYPVLLIEGRPQWTSDGRLVKTFGQDFTRQQYQSLLMSIIFKMRWRYVFTDDLQSHYF